MLLVAVGIMMLKLLLSVILFHCCIAEKIYIIGAGAAGIAAASRLLDNNIIDFKIIEGENRIGGRIYSFFFGEAFVDLGAQYVHGQQNNLVYQLTKDKKILKPGFDNVTMEIYTPGRKKTGDTLMDFLDEFVAKEYDKADEDISIGEKFLKEYNTTILTKYANDQEMKKYAINFIRMCECYILSLEGAFRWFEPSAGESFESCPGDQTQSWDGLGYKTIFDIMLKNYPKKLGYNIMDKVLLNQTISKITLKDEKVLLTTNNGEEFSAEHVIFTPSLSVLKHNHLKLFEPPLSNKKKEVIDLLGMEGVMKIILEFSTSWWGDNKYFVFVWDDDSKKELLKDVPFGPTMNGDHWLSWFFYLSEAPRNPKVMIGWIVGPMVPKIEELTESQMRTGLLYAIKKFLSKDYNVTAPRKVIHSKWCSNPHFKGTYSFEPVRIKKVNIPSPHDVLAEPIFGKDGTPRILFAGEATSPDRFSTVDGAIATGFREAQRLLSGPLKR